MPLTRKQMAVAARMSKIRSKGNRATAKDRAELAAYEEAKRRRREARAAERRAAAAADQAAAVASSPQGSSVAEDDDDDQAEEEEAGIPWLNFDDLEIGGADEFIEMLERFNENARSENLITVPKKALGIMRLGAQFLEKRLLQRAVEYAAEQKLDPELLAAGTVIPPSLLIIIQNYRANRIKERRAAEEKRRDDRGVPREAAPTPASSSSPAPEATPTATHEEAPRAVTSIARLPVPGGRWGARS